MLTPLIKLKKHREHFTDFVNSLRMSKYFRDRQMYITIAKNAFKAENEVFKKHFAKSIGADMLDEKVKVVQISIAKMVFKIPQGYSRSVDKVREHLQATTTSDVKQFLDKDNQLKFINPDNFKLQLKDDEEEKKNNTASKTSIAAKDAAKDQEADDSERDEELEQIK